MVSLVVRVFEAQRGAKAASPTEATRSQTRGVFLLCTDVSVVKIRCGELDSYNLSKSDVAI